MSDTSLQHIPVLLPKILEIVEQHFAKSSKESFDFLDATFGGGGHFSAIYEKFPQARCEAWDRDVAAKERFLNKEYNSERTLFKWCSFGGAVSGLEKKYDLVLADLGLSSFQIDDKGRGMSLFSEAPIDFRMDQEKTEPFKDWLDLHSEKEIADFVFEYGEERKSRRVARFLKSSDFDPSISAAQLAKKLASILKYPAKSRRHPATRTFQALRMAINQETLELENFLASLGEIMHDGSLALIISFHSIEDRLVKHVFRDYACEPNFDILSKKPVLADDEELGANPRSRSAKMRGLTKLQNGQSKEKKKKYAQKSD